MASNSDLVFAGENVALSRLLSALSSVADIALGVIKKDIASERHVDRAFALLVRTGH
jgi:hypothetical protein